MINQPIDNRKPISPQTVTGIRSMREDLAVTVVTLWHSRRETELPISALTLALKPNTQES
jgi:hypothetical protein